MIRFNKPYFSGAEIGYMNQAIIDGKISGNQTFTKKCHQYFLEKYNFKNCLLTTSCTDALEMAALLSDIQKDDEVIIPSYTFVSTSNAFVLRGAKIKFADSYPDNPNIDPEKIESLITPKTKAIVVVHYAGVACDMDKILSIAKKHNIVIIEDAAQAIDSYYKGKALGSFGEYSAFSFHETKNIICGEGGLLVVNEGGDEKRAEIIWEKGTNRSAFFRGEVDKYGWVDVGSSYLPSDILAGFLLAQLENLDKIQQKRKQIWQNYFDGLETLESKYNIQRPFIPDYATNNGHMYYLVCKNSEQRSQLIQHLRSNKIHAVFHYLSLHKSKFFQSQHDGRDLPNCDHFSDCLVRLPFFYELNINDQNFIIEKIIEFFKR